MIVHHHFNFYRFHSKFSLIDDDLCLRLLNSGRGARDTEILNNWSSHLISHLPYRKKWRELQTPFIDRTCRWGRVQYESRAPIVCHILFCLAELGLRQMSRKNKRFLPVNYQTLKEFFDFKKHFLFSAISSIDFFPNFGLRCRNIRFCAKINCR